MAQRWVTASDGVRLAVYEHGDPAAPTVLCVHGFPNDHRVWDEIVSRLAGRFHIVTYDVRGSGKSGAPRPTSAYRLPQLAADTTAIADTVSPGVPVHLLTHDWGSVQSWHAVSTPQLAHRFASLTSVSGPDLDHTGRWYREQLRRPSPARLAKFARQSLASWYVAFFHLYGVADLACLLGLVDLLSRVPHATGLAARNRAGLKLYRANVLPRLWRPGKRWAELPAQVLAPNQDAFVRPPWQTEITDWVPTAEIHHVDGGHWLPVDQPELVADYAAALVERAEKQR
ncbi:alpha/beta fold hydrolase [Actinacidiphila oryziradicis]|uniref:Alpha/beta fold hydrolase n=1 Tax=Actinacidiphila oryziradicis TaxID=2571141 RepID=A0A4U0SCG4_9ACTN|nr:alpha/beta fold hydrolase [Actinacidiphila oryziradicis]TKA06288.1 alpha/beta fold hydrolase [Actinacidiphila oryziradicis]